MGEGLEDKTRSQALCVAEKTPQNGIEGLLTYLIISSEYIGEKRKSSKAFLTTTLTHVWGQNLYYLAWPKYHKL